MLAPVLVFVSSVATFFLNDNMQKLLSGIKEIQYFVSIATDIISLSHHVVIWILFALLYYMLPNAKVRVKSAVISGFMAGNAFNFIQWVYVTFQIGVTSQSVIYGSFAAIPLFLTWLQMSWLILLVGAKITYAIEHNHKITTGELEF